MHFDLAKKYSMPMYFYYKREEAHFNIDTGKGQMVGGVKVDTFKDFVSMLK